MNKVILMGRLTRDAQTRYTEGAEPMAISRFTLAVDRRTQRDQEGQPAPDNGDGFMTIPDGIDDELPFT